MAEKSSPAQSSFPNLTYDEMVELMLIEYEEGRFMTLYPNVSNEELRSVVKKVLKRSGHKPENANKHAKNLLLHNLLKHAEAGETSSTGMSFNMSDFDSDSLPHVSKFLLNSTTIGSENTQLEEPKEDDNRVQEASPPHYKSSIITSPRSANGYGVKISKVSEALPDENCITISDVCSISNPLQSSIIDPLIGMEKLPNVIKGNEENEYKCIYSDEGELTPVSSINETDEPISPIPTPGENLSQQYLGDTSTMPVHNTTEEPICVLKQGEKRSKSYMFHSQSAVPNNIPTDEAISPISTPGENLSQQHLSDTTTASVHNSTEVPICVLKQGKKRSNSYMVHSQSAVPNSIPTDEAISPFSTPGENLSQQCLSDTSTLSVHNSTEEPICVLKQVKKRSKSFVFHSQSAVPNRTTRPQKMPRLMPCTENESSNDAKGDDFAELEEMLQFALKTKQAHDKACARALKKMADINEKLGPSLNNKLCGGLEFMLPLIEQTNLNITQLFLMRMSGNTTCNNKQPLSTKVKCKTIKKIRKTAE